MGAVVRVLWLSLQSSFGTFQAPGPSALWECLQQPPQTWDPGMGHLQAAAWEPAQVWNVQYHRLLTRHASPWSRWHQTVDTACFTLKQVAPDCWHGMRVVWVGGSPSWPVIRQAGPWHACGMRYCSPAVGKHSQMLASTAQWDSYSRQVAKMHKALLNLWFVFYKQVPQLALFCYLPAMADHTVHVLYTELCTQTDAYYLHRCLSVH